MMRSKPVLLAILALILASLSCGQYVTPTPTVPADTPTPRAAKLETHTPTPSATAEATLSGVLIPAGMQTAQVVAAAVNVRAAPDSPEVVIQLFAGMSVPVLGCAENWCAIRYTDAEGKEQTGFVYQGCLSEVNENDLGCTAKE